VLKPTDTPSFASVAHKIGEPRLEPVLAQLARHVQIDIHNAKFVRKRSEIRRSVEKLKADARRFYNTMERVCTFQLPFHDLRNVRRETRDLIDWCGRSLRVVSARAGVGKKPGRATCAMIVIEAWAFVHGKTPRANNHTVHAVCNEYWLACGYKPVGDPRNWCTSMADALKERSGLRHSIRDEVGHGIAPKSFLIPCPEVTMAIAPEQNAFLE
jgi:hypothetical protein